MKKIELFALITILSVIIFSNCGNKDCPDGSHNYIEIINSSAKTINWRLFIQDSIYNLNGESYDEILNPNTTDSYAIRKPTCWEEYFSQINNGFQYFLIFDNDTVKAIGWQAISGTNRGLLKRVKVDLEYLQKNNFTITFRSSRTLIFEN